MKVKFVEAHGPVFLGGKNFGLKLFASATLKMEHIIDSEGDNIHASYNGDFGYIPITNVVVWKPELPAAVIEIKNEHKTEDVRKRKSAQVSTPMGHVFEGEGHGQSGVSLKK